MFFYIVTVLVLFTHGTESEVVDEQFGPCTEFFFLDSPPSGLMEEYTLTPICQHYNNRYQFASAYSSDYRIPFYSAYTIDQFSCQGTQPERKSSWFIEPQLANRTHSSEMMLAGVLYGTYGEVQALNKDYQNSNFDKGHLNPNFYQCDERRTATFTLTNAVPQDPCFNQQEWKKTEELAKKIMLKNCNFSGAKRYFVTGAVPTEYRIPSRYSDTERERAREYERVSVPSLMWTAACCYNPFPGKNVGFSFAYYSHNSADSQTVSVTVEELQNVLIGEYNITSLSIFATSCSPDPDKTTEIIATQLIIPKVRSMVQDVVQYTDANANPFLPGRKRKYFENINTVMTKRPKLAPHIWFLEDITFDLIEYRGKINYTTALLNNHSLTPILSFPDMQHYDVPTFPTHDELRRRITKKRANTKQNNNNIYTNLLDKLRRRIIANDANTKQSDYDIKTIVLDKLRRRMTVNRANTKKNDQLEDYYIVVPFLDGTISASGSRCLNEHPCDFYEETFKWCYIDWSFHWEHCCIDKCGFAEGQSYPRCRTGDEEWTDCSVRGSVLTVDGFRCRADHECGTHGTPYYWCYTDANNNWGYCCQPWHKCSDYGYDRRWCYVGAKKETDWHVCHY